MSAQQDATPMTRTEKMAAVFCPAFLILGAVQVWDAASDGEAHSIWLRVLVLLAGMSVFAGVIRSRRNTECKDERENAIEFKAMRNAFVFLALSIVATGLVARRDQAWSLGEANLALVYLSIALHHASVLFYARRGV